MPFETNILGGSCEGLMICIAQWMNDITQGMFWTLFLLAFVVVVFMGSYRYGTNKAFAYASTSGVFASLIYVNLGLMSWWVTSIFIITDLIALGSLILGNES